jgi:hypothetical protein
VNVAVHDGLARDGAGVDAHVEAHVEAEHVLFLIQDPLSHFLLSWMRSTY